MVLVVPEGLLQLVPPLSVKEDEHSCVEELYVHLHVLQFVHVLAMLADVYRIEHVEIKMVVAIVPVKYLNIPLIR